MPRDRLDRRLAYRLVVYSRLPGFWFSGSDQPHGVPAVAGGAAGMKNAATIAPRSRNCPVAFKVIVSAL